MLKLHLHTYMRCIVRLAVLIIFRAHNAKTLRVELSEFPYTILHYKYAGTHIA